MKKKEPDDPSIKKENSGIEIYNICGETDDEIILQITKRKDENAALKKLLDNLNSTTKFKSKKNV